MNAATPLPAPSRAPGVRRMLVVGSLTPGTTALYLIDAFKRLGCELRVVSDLTHPAADDRANGILDVRRWSKANGFVPDVLFFVEGGTRRLFPCAMEELGCPTAWYAIDTHMHLELHLRLSRLFDLTFIAQREYLEHFHWGETHWLPLAAPESLCAESGAPRDIDVAFVGSHNPADHPERARLLGAIRARHSKVFLGRASPEAIGEISRRAKVVFNKSIRNDVNMRYFEAMAAGAVLVTDKVRGNGVEELFEPGTDFLEYIDEPSLLEVLDRVLLDDAERVRIGARARRTILQRHTYTQRAQRILELLDAGRPRAHPGPEDYMPVFHLMRFPDGVLREAARSLQMIQNQGDHNPLLWLSAVACSGLSRFLAWAYRLRYRLRYWRLARRSASAKH